MRDEANLKQLLHRIDNRGYKAYRDIRGTYDFEDYLLIIDHVQGDPFAAPSRVRIRITHESAGFPPDTYNSKSREIGLRDFLTRRFAGAAINLSGRRRGSGKSGLISIDRPGQEIIERSSVLFTDNGVEARFVMGLPAHGSRIAGLEAEKMFCEELPAIVRRSMFFQNLDSDTLYEHIKVNEDADALREMLKGLGLVAFVAQGAVLPRRSGVDQRPMTGHVIPFSTPETLRFDLELPNRGAISGMGIPEGITLIVGGGYHGKSTLLNALELGVYNHIPGDGREFVVARRSAVKIRAEDGRRVEKVDISPFISNLPFEQDTRAFSTDDASGSTSQAANIMEALEVGYDILLIDEDTSATNFMIRDHRMQELVSKKKEPITPFIDKVHQLKEELGVSTVLVIGGSGDYFDVADTVICMDEYVPRDCTAEAISIAKKYRAERTPEGGERFGSFAHRIPLASGIDARKGKREVKISPKGLHSIVFGTQLIDLGALEQLVDTSQTNAIGDAIQLAKSHMDGNKTLSEVISHVFSGIEEYGLDSLGTYPAGDYAAFRPFELAAAINRLRTLEVETRPH